MDIIGSIDTHGEKDCFISQDNWGFVYVANKKEETPYGYQPHYAEQIAPSATVGCNSSVELH
jgi:hypothetical protein